MFWKKQNPIKNSGLALVIAFAAVNTFASAIAAQAKDPVEPFLSACEKQIAQKWESKCLDEYQIPEHFRNYAKGVIGFVLDSKGNVSKIKIKHSASESLIMAARVRYGQRAEGLMKAMDDSMVAAIQESSPLPSPPWQLDSHHRYAVIYDTQRFKPLRIMIDDRIPVADLTRHFF